ncbi:MAG: hypothetical protein P4M11_13110 [Candidatus Pacebacteria bacterium]|nr:hypothetical protein [Candidatus Paceibacterota bacterium]
MGKERDDAHIFSKLKSADKHAHSALAALEASARPWFRNTVTSAARRAEGECITVTIRSEHIDTTMVCAGDAADRSEFIDLVSMLRGRGLIQWNERIVALYVLEESVWKQVEIVGERLGQGDKVMIVTRLNRTRRQRRSRVGTSLRKALRKL